MAQLQYGSGLRITELVELRVQSLDLDRHRVLIFGGKGNKDRATVLAKKLVPKLRDHLDRLRGLFCAGIARQRSAVWLPRGLERKFSAAGAQWQWQWLFPMAEWSLDRQTGIIRRHHVLDGTFQRVIKDSRAHSENRQTCHPRMFFGTALPRICWSRGSIFAPSRSCLVMPIWRQPRSTLISCPVRGLAPRARWTGERR